MNILTYLFRPRSVQIRLELPRKLRNATKWNLVYSSDQHGISMTTLYHRCRGKGPMILAVKDSYDCVSGYSSFYPPPCLVCCYCVLYLECTVIAIQLFSLIHFVLSTRLCCHLRSLERSSTRNSSQTCPTTAPENGKEVCSVPSILSIHNSDVLRHACMLLGLGYGLGSEKICMCISFFHVPFLSFFLLWSLILYSSHGCYLVSSGMSQP